MPSIALTRTAPPRPPCVSLSSSTSPSASVAAPRKRPNFCFSLLGFKPKRFHFLKPCSSLRETKKSQQQTLPKTPNTAPQSLRRFLNFNPRSENDENRDGDAAEEDGGSGDDAGAIKGTILAGLLLVGVVGGFGVVGYVYREQINAFLTQFSGFIEGGIVEPCLLFFIISSNWFVGSRLDLLLDICGGQRNLSSKGCCRNKS